MRLQHILIPAPFQTDKWVQFAEARPTNRAHVHHIIAFIREPGNPWMKNAKPGQFFVPKRDGEGGGGAGFGDSVAGYAPGMVAPVLQPGIKRGTENIFGRLGRLRRRRAL